MRIFATLGSIAQRLGDNFTISSDVGSVVPSTASRDELLSGLELEVDQNATLLSVISDLSVSDSITVTIDKTSENCVDLAMIIDANQVL